MTQEQILQGSRVLAELEGWTEVGTTHPTYRKYQLGNRFRWEDDFTYHISYDALWPVWEKFRDMDVDFDLLQAHTEYKHKIGRALLYDTIEKAFNLLVDAINDYNRAVRWGQQKGGQQ